MSSCRPSTTTTGSTADCRRATPLSPAKAGGLKVIVKHIPLKLLCLGLGPLVFALARAALLPRAK
jgi:hypothetical protein